MNSRAECQRAGAGRLGVARRIRSEVLELLAYAEPSARRLDAGDRLVARLLIVAPRTGLAAHGQGLDTLDDRVVAADVPVQPAALAVGDDVDARPFLVPD